MGIRQSKGTSFLETERRANKKLDRKIDDVEDVVRDSLEGGAQQMRRVISTNGVRDTVPNNEGRIETGDMLDDVSVRVRRTSRDTVVGRMGWLPGDIKAYYKFQDLGTRGFFTQPGGTPPASSRTKPRGVRPMMAFQEGRIEAENSLRDGLGR